MEEQTFEKLQPSFAIAELVFLQGWGEPLLHPRFWEMARAVKNSGAKASFSTNGTKLNTNNLSALMDSQMDVMGVSLAGAIAETHERLRKGCDFARIDAALCELKKMKRSHEDPPSVHLAFMLLKSNQHELSLLPDLAVEWGVSQVVVSHLSFIANEAMQKESLLTYPDLWPDIENSLGKAQKDSEERCVQFNYHHPVQRMGSTPNNRFKCFVALRIN